jgi:hypothetical protein
LGKKFTHPDLPNPHVITERVTNWHSQIGLNGIRTRNTMYY